MQWSSLIASCPRGPHGDRRSRMFFVVLFLKETVTSLVVKLMLLLASHCRLLYAGKREMNPFSLEIQTFQCKIKIIQLPNSIFYMGRWVFLLPSSRAASVYLVHGMN